MDDLGDNVGGSSRSTSRLADSSSSNMEKLNSSLLEKLEKLCPTIPNDSAREFQNSPRERGETVRQKVADPAESKLRQAAEEPIKAENSSFDNNGIPGSYVAQARSGSDLDATKDVLDSGTSFLVSKVLMIFLSSMSPQVFRSERWQALPVHGKQVWKVERQWCDLSTGIYKSDGSSSFGSYRVLGSTGSKLGWMTLDSDRRCCLTRRLRKLLHNDGIKLPTLKDGLRFGPNYHRLVYQFYD